MQAAWGPNNAVSSLALMLKDLCVCFHSEPPKRVQSDGAGMPGRPLGKWSRMEWASLMGLKGVISSEGPTWTSMFMGVAAAENRPSHCLWDYVERTGTDL